MEIDTKFFVSLLEKVDKESLLQRWVSGIPNLPNNLYWEAGAPIRSITKAAFEFTCKTLELSMDNNYCLNTIAVPIEDYLRSHKERLSYLTGGSDTNYELLNKIASYLGNMEESGIKSVSPAYIMTLFVKNIRAHNDLKAVFPIDSTGIIHGGFKETLVAQMLALTHILEAMVTGHDPKTFYPGLWELGSDRYRANNVSMVIAIVLIVVTLIMFIKNMPKMKAACFAMKVCNSAIRLICNIMASILIPGLVHAPQAIAAITDVRGRMIKWITPKDMKKVLPALKDSKGIKEATKDKCDYKDTKDTSTGGSTTKDTKDKKDSEDTKVPSKPKVRTKVINTKIINTKIINTKITKTKGTNTKGTNTKAKEPTKAPGCSLLRKADCIKAVDRCVWHVNRGCRKV